MLKSTLLEMLRDYPADTDIQLLRWNAQAGKFDVLLLNPTCNEPPPEAKVFELLANQVIGQK